MKNLMQKSGSTNGLLNLFLRGRPSTTREAYKNDLEDFNRHFQGGSVPTTVKALLESGSGKANAVVYSYRVAMEEAGLSPATINRRISALRSLTKFARQFGLINWKIEVENVKVTPYRDTRGPGKERIYLLIEKLRKLDSRKAKRDLAIVMLLYSLALRASELINLNLKDLELEKKRLWIRGKGRKEKTQMALPDSVIETLGNWIAVRGDWDGPVFTSLDRSMDKTKRLTRSGLYKLIRKLGVKTGLGVQVRPHGFRHTAITEAVKSAHRSGITLNEVLQFSRHSSLQVLQVYADQERNVQGKLSDLVIQSI